MQISDIEELHFITYIENVPSILNLGILSHNKSQKLNFRDISENSVQERRKKKKIPGTNKILHDYANLYFDAHNPMLSARRSENNEICVLRIDNSVLSIDGVIVTDQNAAKECWFKPVNIGLLLLNSNEIYAKFWLDDNYLEQERLKGIKCAEVLVPNYVHSDYIIGAYIANKKALNKLYNLTNFKNVTIKNGLFF